MSEYLSVEKADYVEGYKLSLTFNDAKRVVVDFGRFILNSTHPDIKKYRDLKLFKSYTLKNGDLEWNDYELAFPVYDLHQGAV